MAEDRPGAGAPQRFGSRLGLILSVLGIAVGTGNIWRFPRIAAQNAGDDGAGAFLVAWAVALVTWSIPLIIAEYALGRHGRAGVVGSFVRVAGPGFAWAGAFVGLVASAIMAYYAVVTGWCAWYALQSLAAPLPTSASAAQAAWDGFQTSFAPVVMQALALALAGIAVARGVRSIERVNLVLVPALLLIVLLALARALTLPGAFRGVAFLFTPTWSTLAQPQVWLEALTQNAWDTGAGWGLILTYAAYMRREDGVVRNALITGVGNNTVSLIAAMMVFGTVFATLGQGFTRDEVLTIMRESGPASTGLTFVWMPRLFQAMGGGTLGPLLALAFFLGLTFAAISSLLAMVELAVRALADAGLSRPRALAWVLGLAFLAGVPSARDLVVFGNQDFVWGVALILSGGLVARAIAVYGVERFARDAIAGPEGTFPGQVAFVFALRWLVPAQALALLGWWMWQAATVFAPDAWYDPRTPYSVGSCLVHWGGAGGLLWLLNARLAAPFAGALAGADGAEPRAAQR